MSLFFCYHRIFYTETKSTELTDISGHRSKFPAQWRSDSAETAERQTCGGSKEDSINVTEKQEETFKNCLQQTEEEKKTTFIKPNEDSKGLNSRQHAIRFRENFLTECKPTQETLKIQQYNIIHFNTVRPKLVVVKL